MSMNQNSSDSVDQIVRATQIVVGALIIGVTIFLVIVVCLVHLLGFGNAVGAANPGVNAPAAQQPAKSIPTLTYVSAGMGIILLPLSFILPNVLATQSLRSAAARATAATPSSSPPPGAAVTSANAYQTSMIIGGAIAEGAAFFAGVVYLIEQNPIALGVFVILLAALILQFPTRSRFDRWVERQEERLRRE
jgi:hypothetical protein